MSNTIEEILKKKLKEGKICTNRYNIWSLCKITIIKDRKSQYINYAQCMQNKCKTCKGKQKCERNK